jgi:hypothetical protein
MLVSLACLLALAYYFTGSILPNDTQGALIFQSALLLLILGSALIEDKFTKPADSVVNSLMGIITLVGAYKIAPKTLWWIVFTYCLYVFTSALLCTAVSSSKALTGWRHEVARYTYKPAVVLGAARRLFSIIFLFGLLSFYHLQSYQTISLVLFWGFFVVLWPIGIPQLLSSFRPSKSSDSPIGNVIRTDWPNLIRVELNPDARWNKDNTVVYQRSDGKQIWVLPLYSQVRDQKLLGTGLCLDNVSTHITNLNVGCIYSAPDDIAPSANEITIMLGGRKTSKLIGFVIEESNIGEIRLEVLNPKLCTEGMLVWSPIDQKEVFYQITHGINKEEVLESEHHGFQIAKSAQLGIPDNNSGFIKYDWVPPMNTPVFVESDDFGADLFKITDQDFVYGNIPKSKIPVAGPFLDTCDHHAAILGITGSGKTELAFDLIRHAIKKEEKVICIDLTAQYSGRLDDLSPQNLSITEALATELSYKLFEVETGQYGAGKEKAALKEFADKLRDDVIANLKKFLMSKDPDSQLGIINLEEISNTKATLFITELYLTCLLRYARENLITCPRVLIVVEEAHTVMPEPSTMGLGDFDSKGLVGKIAQIALQGRKYNIGLLVIAQRTATVSKSVLTQCNTVISFTSYDDTSLNFLRNIFGSTHVELIPNLPKLQAVLFGKGVKSERPIVIEIPYDSEKAKKTV